MDDRTSPEPTEENIDAAVKRIRAAFDDRYMRDALLAKHAAVRLLLMTAFAALFIRGMPLHSLFHPWGQVVLVLWIPVCGWALMSCTIFVTEWFDRRKHLASGDR